MMSAGNENMPFWVTRIPTTTKQKQKEKRRKKKMKERKERKKERKRTNKQFNITKVKSIQM